MSVPHQAFPHAPALVQLIAGLTGLHIAMLAAPALGRTWDLRRLIAGCRAHGRGSNGARRSARCGACVQAHVRRALAAPGLGDDHEGPCGVRSFLLPVRGFAGPVGLLAVRREPTGNRRGRLPAETRSRRRDAIFRRAVRLLRPMAHEAAWRAEGDGHAEDSGSVGGMLAPAGRAARSESSDLSPVCEARSRRVVRGLIERVRREFAEPLALKGLAHESGLNPSYLSTVFAREAGIAFKAYLTAVRLENAQVLLGDPRLPIARVAREVGYASQHRFRAAFRAWTGLSPGRWRAARFARPRR